MSDKPILRQIYDRVADEVSPQLTQLTASDDFASFVDVATAVQDRMSTELQRSSRRFLHSLNLPAGTDVAVLRHEIGELDRMVRRLTRQVETLQRRLDDVDADVVGSKPDAPSRRRAS
jgi:hypothetical protein